MGSVPLSAIIVVILAIGPSYGLQEKKVYRGGFLKNERKSVYSSRRLKQENIATRAQAFVELERFPVPAEPPANAEPLTIEDPPATEEPHSAAQPPVTGEPPSTAQPPATEEPPSAALPPVTEEPHSTAQPPIAEESHFSAQPPVTEEPPSAAQPPVTEEPHSTAQPPVTEEPHSTAQPPVTEEPHSTAQPPVTEEPPAVAQPPATGDHQRCNKSTMEDFDCMVQAVDGECNLHWTKEPDGASFACQTNGTGWVGVGFPENPGSLVVSEFVIGVGSEQGNGSAVSTFRLEGRAEAGVIEDTSLFDIEDAELETGGDSRILKFKRLFDEKFSGEGSTDLVVAFHHSSNAIQFNGSSRGSVNIDIS